MRNLAVVAILLATLYALASGRNEFLPGQIVPFQPITAEEYNAILDLSNGRKMISEARLIGSSLTAIRDIASNIRDGAMTALNLTGLEPIYSSIFKQHDNRLQGYPLCVIRTNRLGNRSPRHYGSEYDSTDDGAFSVNYYHPGSGDDNDDDDDIHGDEYEHPYPQRPSKPIHSYRPHNPTHRPTSTTSTHGNTDDDDIDENGHNTAPVVNCVVVLKRPTTPGSSTPPSTPAPTYRPHRPYRPSRRPSYHQQNPYTTTTTTTQKPDNAHYPHFPIYPYPIIPIPFPPYPNYPGSPSSPGHPSPPSSPSWPHWPGSPSSPSEPAPIHPSSPSPPQWTHRPGSPQSPSYPAPPTWPHWPGPHGTPSEPGSSPPSSPNPPQWPHWPGSPANTPINSHNPNSSNPHDVDNSPRPHYPGHGAKAAIYDDATYQAPEIDDEIEIDSDIGDVAGAIQAAHKKQIRRYRKSHFKVLPIIRVPTSDEV